MVMNTTPSTSSIVSRIVPTEAARESLCLIMSEPLTKFIVRTAVTFSDCCDKIVCQASAINSPASLLHFFVPATFNNSLQQSYTLSLLKLAASSYIAIGLLKITSTGLRIILLTSSTASSNHNSDLSHLQHMIIPIFQLSG